MEVQKLGETLDGYAEYFKAAIKYKECELWSINGGESYCITRLEVDKIKNRTTVAVCCYKGKNLEAFVNHLISICDANGFYIRFHTVHKSLTRWMQRKFKFKPFEFVNHREPI